MIYRFLPSILGFSLLIGFTYGQSSTTGLSASQLQSSLDQARVEVVARIDTAEQTYATSLQTLSNQYQTDSRVQSLQCLGVLDVKNMLSIASGNYINMKNDLYNDYLILSNRINETANKAQLGLINNNQAQQQYMSLYQDIINFQSKYTNLLQQIATQFSTTYSGAQTLINGFVKNNTLLLNELGHKRSLVEPYMSNMKRLDDLIRQSAVIINGVNATGTTALFDDLKTTTLTTISQQLDRTIQNYSDEGYLGLPSLAQDYKQSLINEYSLWFDQQFVNMSSGFTNQRTVDQLRAVQTIIVSQFYRSGSLDCSSLMTTSLDLTGLVSPVTPLLTGAIDAMSAKLQSLQSPESMTAYRLAIKSQLEQIYTVQGKALQKKLIAFLLKQIQGLDARHQLQQQAYTQLLANQDKLTTLDPQSEAYRLLRETIINEARYLYKQSVKASSATQLRKILHRYRQTLQGEPLVMNTTIRRLNKAMNSYISSLRESHSRAGFIQQLQTLRSTLINRREGVSHSSRNLFTYIIDEIDHALYLAQ